ncbi:MAG: ABC transporter ATP-binding protein [Sulfobacillus thermosulfidooxidans]|uniref:ABC transporter ATP-binding protein n=1 Tax=Sulfobacillus thermosulfidooxidans TaxID=28034 RepID=A0A2T2WRA3_SULTH|nr:MAG: ABC transporter ATP-binding protein [Sulfobacillus thermosulfidooxidans]
MNTLNSRKALLSLNDLNFGYGKESLFVNADIEIGEGETVRLTGANGTGKTTLLKILSGVIDRGVQYRVQWRGQSVKSVDEIRQRISFAVDTPQLFEELSCKENIEVMQLLWELDTSYFDAVVDLCANMGMDETLFERPVKSCSLGTQHKLFLAMVLARPADLYLLDEPFNTLDQSSRGFIARRITNDPNHSYLIVSHLAQPGLEFNRTLNILDIAGPRQISHVRSYE